MKAPDLKLRGSREYTIFDVLAFVVNDPNGNTYGESFQFVYIEGVYDEMTPDSPILYLVNTDIIFRVDPYDYAYYDFKVRPQVVNFLNGTQEVFYTLKYTYFSYAYSDPTDVLSVTFSMDDEYDIYTQYTYYQPDLSAYMGRRNLNTTTTSGTVKEETKVPVIYEVFYVYANLGGLYVFCLFVVGFFLRPIVDKMFMHETVNAVHRLNKQEIAKLKKDEERYIGGQMGHSQSMRQDPMSSPKKGQLGVEQRFHEDEPLMGMGKYTKICLGF